MYCMIGGFTLDDTVLPSGEIQWSAPGGNALYSAVGAKLWNVDVGIVARIGSDYPEEYLNTLGSYGFDLQGVKRIDHPSFHVWILHEGGGSRQIIYRLNSGNNEHLDPDPQDIPPSYFSAKGCHICPILGSSQSALMEELISRTTPGFIDLVNIKGQIDVTAGFRPDLWGKMRAFLPSIEEVRGIWGNLPLQELFLKTREAITQGIFAIKMGSRGSLLWHPDEQQIYHIPIFKANVVDATGAGDGYCGGFMAGLQETGDPVQASIWGTVSASFVIEGFGAIHALNASLDNAMDRLKVIESEIQILQEDELVAFD